ncbi:MAG: flavin reductase family protein [Candidatus Saccharimonadales bacterium]|jgi:flavin reductase (DIM6/NTAB) family NADH-FMN oxidoreductase RutF
MKPQTDIVYAMRRSLIEPTVFVLSVDANGKPNGMAAGWNMKCSYKPPTLAVALQDTNNTHKLILESKEFVIAVPSPELRRQLEYFGSVSGADVDKFAESGIATLPGTIGKTPLLADARVNFECRLHSYAKPADHYVFFGTIIAAYLNEEKEQLFYTGRDKVGERTFRSVKGF